MKFRDFVGEERINRTKNKNVQKSKKHVNEVFLEFGVSKKSLKRVFDYIRSWFMRYKIDFESENPYFTMFKVGDMSYADTKIIEEINKTNEDIYYKSDGTMDVIKNYDVDGIYLNYFNSEYDDLIKSILNKYNIDVLSREGKVKLFEVKSEVIDKKMYDEIVYSCPPISDIKINNIRLRGKDGDF